VPAGGAAAADGPADQRFSGGWRDSWQPRHLLVHSPPGHSSLPLCLPSPARQALGQDELKGVEGLRRRSVQVCDVHRRLKDMSIEVGRGAVLRAACGPCALLGWVGG
jgi:hypothetical protein